VDILDLLVTNPQVQQFLTSLGLSVAKEAGQKIGKWVVNSISTKLTHLQWFEEKRIEESKNTLEGLFIKKPVHQVSLLGNYWIEFLTFMFPEREVEINKLTENDCDYVAQRIFTAMCFEQLLLDTQCNIENIRYMTYFSGIQSRDYHYFDLKARFEQRFFDNFLCARVIDIMANSPLAYVNSLPRVVSDINGNPNTPSVLRDHDVIAVVLSRDPSNRTITRLRSTIRSVQETSNIILPRLILFTNQELLEILGSQNPKDRSTRLERKLQEVKLYRGG